VSIRAHCAQVRPLPAILCPPFSLLCMPLRSPTLPIRARGLQVRPLPVGWPPGHCIFRIKIAGPADGGEEPDPAGSKAAAADDAVAGNGEAVSRAFVFSASSVEERARWIAVLTKPLRRAVVAGAPTPLPERLPSSSQTAEGQDPIARAGEDREKRL
jgi:hypothetical protein